MKDLKGATAIVTGAANGIGLGICRALARAGVTVGLADIEADGLARATEEIAAIRPGATSFLVDVSDGEALRQTADAARQRLGDIHILINNAGVSAGGAPILDVEPNQWEWLFGVNVHGVLNGLRAFVPGMLAHGKPGHIVNTASIGGLQVNPILRHGSYSTSKYAVVALTEALRLDLEATNLGVSVFCPALVLTTLDRSGSRRPDRFGGAYEQEAAVFGEQSAINFLPPVSPDEAGERVVHGIRENELFLLTHQEVRQWLDARHQRIMSGFDSLTRFLEERHAGNA